MASSGTPMPKVLRGVQAKMGAQITNPDCVLPWWDTFENVCAFRNANLNAIFVSEYGELYVLTPNDFQPKYPSVRSLVKGMTIQDTVIWLAGLEALKCSNQLGEIPASGMCSILELLFWT